MTPRWWCRRSRPKANAESVHLSADYTPYGRRRDEAVALSLSNQGRTLLPLGSPYAIAPGRVVKVDGTPYRVYTPYYRAWLAHGWRARAGPAPLADVRGL